MTPPLQSTFTSPFPSNQATWGVLYSQSSQVGERCLSLSAKQVRDCNLVGPNFTIGRSSKCNVVIRDPSVSSVACRIYAVSVFCFLL